MKPNRYESPDYVTRVVRPVLTVGLAGLEGYEELV
jgi:hypothetical protein